MTDLKALQEQIRRSDRLASMGTLSAGMAHEIKNPLVTIKTFTQLLPERYDDDDFRDTFRVLVGDEVKRIDSHRQPVAHLLAAGQAAHGGYPPVTRCSDNSLRLVEQELRRKNIAHRARFRLTLDLIRGDADLLSQAFVELLPQRRRRHGDGGGFAFRRARRTTIPRHASWTPAAHADGFAPHATIVDSGEGIKEKDLARIFDPFFTTKSNGTGLGLAVAHGIIEEHGGIIDVQSELGKGTTVSVIASRWLGRRSRYEHRAPCLLHTRDPELSRRLLAFLRLRADLRAVELGGRPWSARSTSPGLRSCCSTCAAGVPRAPP